MTTTKPKWHNYPFNGLDIANFDAGEVYFYANESDIADDSGGFKALNATLILEIEGNHVQSTLDGVLVGYDWVERAECYKRAIDFIRWSGLTDIKPKPEPRELGEHVYGVRWIEVEFGQRDEGWALYVDLDECKESTKKASANGVGEGGYYGPERPLKYYEIPLASLTEDQVENLRFFGFHRTDRKWSPKYFSSHTPIITFHRSSKE